MVNIFAPALRIPGEQDRSEQTVQKFLPEIVDRRHPLPCRCPPGPRRATDTGQTMPPTNTGHLLPPTDTGHLLPPTDTGHLLPPTHRWGSREGGHQHRFNRCNPCRAVTSGAKAGTDTGHLVPPTNTGHLLPPTNTGAFGATHQHRSFVATHAAP